MTGIVLLFAFGVLTGWFSRQAWAEATEADRLEALRGGKR